MKVSFGQDQKITLSLVSTCGYIKEKHTILPPKNTLAYKSVPSILRHHLVASPISQTISLSTEQGWEPPSLVVAHATR